MKIDQFDYNLPKELIAQEPVEPRDHSRLFVYNQGKVEHKNFFNITDYLQSGDILVLNDSKVFPARLIGKKHITGGKVEIFLLNQEGDNWHCLVGNVKPKLGMKIDFDYRLQAEIIDVQAGRWLVKFNKTGQKLMEIIKLIGQTPLPPYIKTKDSDKIRNSYQTVYAENEGSVAAPTAGLHFTDELLNKLEKKGIKILKVTLHVGLGTFAPVKVENIRDHQMHSEYYEINKSTWNLIKNAKQEKNKVVAVGTTAVRVLETAAKTEKLSGWTDIFIYPGYDFKIIDSLLTNFHLPKSTLLMLVAAFLQNKEEDDGVEKIKELYRQAIEQQYRFYSFGDAMFIV